MEGKELATATATAADIRWVGTDLEPLGERERARLAQIAATIEYEPGALILHEGRPTPFLGVLTAGRIALRLQVPARGPYVVVTLEPGDVFGWSTLVPPHRATSDAVALTPVLAVALDAERLRVVLRDDHELAAQLLPIVLRCVSERLTTSWHQLLDLFGMRGVGPW
jgi:CRP/FNR family transcriptional regulator, cyclic AMP receptor protein